MKPKIADKIINRLVIAAVVSLLLFSVTAKAQGTAPLWIDGDVRNVQYPQEIYYSGFAEISVAQNETQEAAMVRARQRAMGELSDRVRVMVNSQKTQTDISLQGSDMDEQFRSKFTAVVQTGSTAELTGSKMESWYNSQTRTAYAFAYVSREQLATYYRAQLNVDLNKAETAIAVAEEQVRAGKKMSARRKVDEARKVFADVNFYRDLLVAVNPQADETSLQTQRGSDLQRTAERLYMKLEQSTFVYMECSHEFRGERDDAFSSDPGILCDIIAQALSENECSITENREEADFELTLITSTSMRSSGGNNALLSYYANVRGTLYNHATNRRTAEFNIFNDADAYSAARNPHEAATRAFRKPELKEKVMNSILPRIKN